MSAVLAFDGCYDAARTAALSGVPRSTVYDWAHKDLVVPSISPERQMLWSYADLMTLRIVSWLRRPKHLGEDARPGTAMKSVRIALSQLGSRGLDVWSDAAGVSPLFVDRKGEIYIVDDAQAYDLAGQGASADWLDLLGPFDGIDGHGPDLRRPRPNLRIVPGKCAGEPHVAGSRLTTITVAALAERGYDLDDIARLYPDARLLPGEFDAALKDDRLVLGGADAAIAHNSAVGLPQQRIAYVRSSDVDEFLRDHFGVRDNDRPNLLLRVVGDDV